MVVFPPLRFRNSTAASEHPSDLVLLALRDGEWSRAQGTGESELEKG